MPPKSNPLCPCKKSGAWRTEVAARLALAAIQNRGEARAYTPVNVDRCSHGVWHLTSKSGKEWRSGKRKRGRR